MQNTTTMQQPLIFVIDDEKSYNVLSVIMLKEAGFTNIQSFMNPQEALDQLRERCEKADELPHLILLDINMPKISAWQFLDEYRLIQTDRKSEINIFLCTGSDHHTDIEKAKQYPEVLGMLSKPLGFDSALMLSEKFYLVSAAA